jgi:phage-related protein
MKINDWDISSADARQWNVTPGFHSIKNDSEWNRGSPVPEIFKNEIEFKTVKVSLLVKTTGGRQAILNRCSEILSHLLEPVELTLDQFEHKFYGILTKHSHNEKSMNRWHVLTLEFDGYEYAKTETVQTFSGTTDFTVSNTGNIITPAIVELTSSSSLSAITLSGICRDSFTGEDLPVTVNHLSAGRKVILDGETGLFTQDGSLKSDIEIWGLPTLLPGNNRILSSNGMDITVRFHPRFM